MLFNRNWIYRLKELILLLLIISFSGCSSSTEIPPNKLPESKTIFLKSNNLEIIIPPGWREVKDNYNKVFDVWLVNDNSNASIGIIPINLSPDSSGYNSLKQLETIEKILLVQKTNSAEDFELIEANNLNLVSSEKEIRYTINGVIQNSIIFGDNGSYFELIAFFKANYEYTDDELSDLIKLQKDILKNLKITN